MYFLNLEDLKIQKEYNFITRTAAIAPRSTSLGDIKAAAETMDIIFMRDAPSLLGLMYEIDINDIEMDADEFLGCVNAILGVFFKRFIKDEGRQREHRLAVPVKLQTVKCSMGMLRKCINQKTHANLFNLKINCGEWTFILVDEKGATEDGAK